MVATVGRGRSLERFVRPLRGDPGVTEETVRAEAEIMVALCAVGEPVSVLALAEGLGMPRHRVVTHLNALADLGLVTSRKSWRRGHALLWSST